jgi:hypothetical protein
MRDRTNPANWPGIRGPWPEVTGLDRLFDHGAPWCANAAGHPDPEDGYPDPEIHRPFDECQSLILFVDNARADLAGPPYQLTLYGARPFRFGEPRDRRDIDRTRVMFDLADPADDAPPQRFSIPLAEALMLDRHLIHLVSLLS